MCYYDIFLIDFLRVESLGTKDSCFIYGEIFVVDFDRKQYIFNRDLNNPLKVKVGDELPLSVPEYFICAEGDCHIYVHLFDAEDEHQIADGLVSWVMSSPYPYNKTLSRKIIGERDCSFLVQYIVLSRSSKADIQIKFPITNPLRFRDGEEKEKLEICGSVKVQQNFGLAADRDPKTITLFEKVENEAVAVEADQAIPLLVPYVIAQAPKEELPSLNISLDLWGRGISRGGSETAPFLLKKEISEIWRFRRFLSTSMMKLATRTPLFFTAFCLTRASAIRRAEEQ